MGRLGSYDDLCTLCYYYCDEDLDYGLSESVVDFCVIRRNFVAVAR